MAGEIDYISEANLQPNLKAKQAYYSDLASAFDWAIRYLGGQVLSADLNLHGSPEVYGTRREKQAQQDVCEVTTDERI